MRALIAALLLALAGCGFQLRGTAQLPFDTIYIPGASGGIALDLKRNLQAGTDTKVVDNPAQVQAILQFTQETREKVILSLDPSGRVREFELRYTVGFLVRNTKGTDYVPPSQIELKRDISFNDSAVLSKESEEALLWRDMESDMVQQIMRRLASAKPAKG